MRRGVVVRVVVLGASEQRSKRHISRKHEEGGTDHISSKRTQEDDGQAGCFSDFGHKRPPESCSWFSTTITTLTTKRHPTIHHQGGFLIPLYDMTRHMRPRLHETIPPSALRIFLLSSYTQQHLEHLFAAKVTMVAMKLSFDSAGQGAWIYHDS